jgi:glycosyltransferase involved in cell wall biosynthesis
MKTITMQTHQFGFLFSTEVGLRTQYENIRREIDRLGLTQQTEWIVVDWFRQDGWIERLPLIPWTIKTRLRAELELMHGLRAGPFSSGLLIGAPATIYGHQQQLRHQPYFVSIDCTPRQLASFGDLYGKAPSKLLLLEHYKERERRALYQNARALFPWSRWAGESMVADYRAEAKTLHIIPPGVDLDQWKMPERERSETTHLLFVGGDFYRKGGDLLLDWASRTNSKHWKLHLVTREPVLTVHPNIIVYHQLSSNDPRLIALYQQANLFVLPTRGDCYSLAGIEALASGLPILLGDTGGTSEVVTDGVTGFLLPQDNTDALFDRLDTLIQTPELLSPMGHDARRDAETRFDVRKNVAQMLDLMQRYLTD